MKSKFLALVGFLLFSAAAFAAPMEGMLFVMDAINTSGTTSYVYRIEAGGQWREIGKIPGLYSISATTSDVFAASVHTPRPITHLWDLRSPAQPRTTPGIYEAMAPFSTHEILAYEPALGLILLTQTGEVSVCDDSVVGQLHDVSIARVGARELLVFGTTSAGPSNAPDTFKLLHLEITGAGGCSVRADIPVPNAIRGRQVLLNELGAFFTAGSATQMHLAHQPIGGQANFTPMVRQESFSRHEANRDLLLVRDGAALGVSGPALYYRVNDSLHGISLVNVGPGQLLDSLFFSLAKIAPSRAASHRTPIGTWAGWSRYSPPMGIFHLVPYGTASVPRPAMSGPGVIASRPTGGVAILRVGTYNTGNLMAASGPPTVPVPAAPPAPTLESRFATLWVAAHAKRVLQSPTVPQKTTSGTLVQVLENLLRESEWLSNALREIGAANYEPFGLRFSTSWSTPSMSQEVDVAQFLVAVAQAKSCGGTLIRIP